MVMDYIDRQAAIDVLKEKVFHNLTDEFYGTMQVLDELPSADVEPVVRCKDCANWNSETHGCLRNPSVSPWWENDFCSYGERTDGEQDA